MNKVISVFTHYLGKWANTLFILSILAQIFLKKSEALAITTSGIILYLVFCLLPQPIDKRIKQSLNFLMLKETRILQITGWQALTNSH